MAAIQQSFLLSTGWGFRSVGTTIAGINPSVTLPAGTVKNDLLVIAGTGNTAGMTTPAGWTLWASDPSPFTFAYVKIHSGTESTVSMTGGGAGGQVAMLAYYGIDSNPVDSAGASNTVTATSVATSALNTNTANTMFASFYSTANGAGTITAPANTTTRLLVQPVAGTSGGFCWVDELKVTAGAVTTRTLTATSSALLQAHSLGFKIVP